MVVKIVVASIGQAAFSGEEMGAARIEVELPILVVVQETSAQELDDDPMLARQRVFDRESS